MTDITKTSDQSLNNILNKLGINSSDDAASSKKDSSTLGQAEFLKLMTAQLQNQDPFAPMDNGDFIAQMAQFSTVTGITEINTNLTNLGDKLEPNRIATAASFLGTSVLVPGQTVTPDDNGEIHGVIDLPASSTNVGLTISNTKGEVFHTIDLGSQTKGLVGFSWTDIPEDIIRSNQKLSLQAFAGNGNATDGLSTAVYNKVISASTPKDSEDVLLELKDFGEISSSEAIKLKSLDKD
jgi:flagellar basal-body rod modification protein FlgD